MKLTDEQKELYILLFKKYKKAQLNQKEVSKILGVSIDILHRWREKEGVRPSYKKMESGTIVYSLLPLVRYLTKLNVQIPYSCTRKKYNWIVFTNRESKIYIFKMIVNICKVLRLLNILNELLS